MTTEKLNIDLAKYKSDDSSVFTGRPQGNQVRKDLKLDLYDLSDKEIYFVIPSETTSFNPSFYLGLVFKSIEVLGAEKFNEKYHFIFETQDLDMREALIRNISDGFRSALNSVGGNFGFFTFLNNVNSK